MSYRVCRDDERTNCQIITRDYIDCSEDERRIGCNRLGSMSHRHEKRSEYHKASKTDSYPRGRSRYREEISNLVNFRRHRSKQRTKPGCQEDRKMHGGSNCRCREPCLETRAR